MIFALVRTGPDVLKHNGISYLLDDMPSPGVTVRLLVQMSAGIAEELRKSGKEKSPT